MARQVSVVRAAFLLVFMALPLNAQVIESPIAFDSAGRIRVLTPSLVERLDLRPPVWPVVGNFLTARLYSIRDDGIVLSVERPNGDVERYPFTEEQLAAIRQAIQLAVAIDSVRVVDRPTEPQVRNAFARNQMILSALIYGPLVASFAEEAKTATALYLLSVGASFFAVNNVARNTQVTRPQNDLATDGAIRGAAGTSGLLFAFGGDNIDRRVYSAIALAGSLGGSLAGFEFGKRLTETEGQAARKVSTLSAATALGVLGSIGVLDDDEGQARVGIGAAVVSGGIGYLLGPNYPRRASYNVTGGDVRLLHVGALIGMGVGVTPVSGEQHSGQLRWSLATAGMLLGATVVERTWIRRFDHDHNDATTVWLGTIAGMLLGGAVAVLAEPDQVEPVFLLLSGGALLGALGGHSVARPAPARPRPSSR